MKKIYFNKAQCRLCGSIIVSKKEDELVNCSCGTIAISGGYEFLKRFGDLNNLIEISVVIDLDLLKDLHDFKDLINDYHECLFHIEELEKDYLKNKDTASEFSNNIYFKYCITEPEISTANTNLVSTSNDERTQLFINLNAVKRIVIESIVKKQREVTNVIM